MYKYLLFDADNTLMDFNAAEENALKETLVECPIGFSEQVHKRYHEINDNEWKRLEKGETTRERLKYERFEKLYTEFGFDGTLYGKSTADIYIKKLSSQGQMIDGAYEVLAALSKKYECYIVTNGTASVQKARMAKTDLHKYIKDTFISEEIGYSKPSALFFDYVLDHINDRDKSKYLVIGDSLSSDIAGAVNSAIDCVFVSEDQTTDMANYNIKALRELYSIL